MNYLTTEERANLNLVQFSNRVGSQLNVFRFGINETKEHILKKLEIFIELRKQGENLITEAKFNKGGRADIFSLNGYAVEVLNSEKEKTCDLKDYPVRVIKIRV